MNRKAALSLSVNFLVIIIICIVIFSFSIYMVRKFFTHAENIKMIYDDRTEKEIERLLDDGSRIAIPFDRKTIPNSEFETFGIGVLNMLDTADENIFRVIIGFSKAYDNDDNLIPTPTPHPNTWLKTTSGEGTAGMGIITDRTIKNNKQEKFLLGVDVDGATPGIYIFDLNVQYINQSGDFEQYDTPHKLYVEVP